MLLVENTSDETAVRDVHLVGVPDLTPGTV